MTPKLTSLLLAAAFLTQHMVDRGFNMNVCCQKWKYPCS